MSAALELFGATASLLEHLIDRELTIGFLISRDTLPVVTIA
jgi:hypothetical protein